MICLYSSWGLKCFNKSYFGKLGHEATINVSFYTWLQNLFINHTTLHCTKSRSPSILKLMNECLTTPHNRNKSAIGCQTNGIYIKHKKSNVYKLNHRLYLTKYITKTVYKDWNCLEWFYSTDSNIKVNYTLTLFSILFMYLGWTVPQNSFLRRVLY